MFQQTVQTLCYVIVEMVHFNPANVVRAVNDLVTDDTNTLFFIVKILSRSNIKFYFCFFEKQMDIR